MTGNNGFQRDRVPEHSVFSPATQMSRVYSSCHDSIFQSASIRQLPPELSTKCWARHRLHKQTAEAKKRQKKNEVRNHNKVVAHPHCEIESSAKTKPWSFLGFTCSFAGFSHLFLRVIHYLIWSSSSAQSCHWLKYRWWNFFPSQGNVQSKMHEVNGGDEPTRLPFPHNGRKTGEWCGNWSDQTWEAVALRADQPPSAPNALWSWRFASGCFTAPSQHNPTPSHWRLPLQSTAAIGY